MERSFQVVNGNFRQMAIMPRSRQGREGIGESGNQDGNVLPVGNGVQAPAPAVMTPQQATLMPTPRSLHDLWVEFEHGVGGRKATKLFTPAKRGQLVGIIVLLSIQMMFYYLLPQMTLLNG